MLSNMNNLKTFPCLILEDVERTRHRQTLLVDSYNGDRICLSCLHTRARERSDIDFGHILTICNMVLRDCHAAGSLSDRMHELIDAIASLSVPLFNVCYSDHICMTAMQVLINCVSLVTATGPNPLSVVRKETVDSVLKDLEEEPGFSNQRIRPSHTLIRLLRNALEADVGFTIWFFNQDGLLLFAQKLCQLILSQPTLPQDWFIAMECLSFGITAITSGNNPMRLSPNGFLSVLQASLSILKFLQPHSLLKGATPLLLDGISKLLFFLHPEHLRCSLDCLRTTDGEDISVLIASAVDLASPRLLDANTRNPIAYKAFDVIYAAVNLYNLVGKMNPITPICISHAFSAATDVLLCALSQSQLGNDDVVSSMVNLTLTTSHFHSSDKRSTDALTRTALFLLSIAAKTPPMIPYTIVCDKITQALVCIPCNTAHRESFCSILLFLMEQHGLDPSLLRFARFCMPPTTPPLLSQWRLILQQQLSRSFEQEDLAPHVVSLMASDVIARASSGISLSDLMIWFSNQSLQRAEMCLEPLSHICREMTVEFSRLELFPEMDSATKFCFMKALLQMSTTRADQYSHAAPCLAVALMDSQNSSLAQVQRLSEILSEALLWMQSNEPNEEKTVDPFSKDLRLISFCRALAQLSSREHVHNTHSISWFDTLCASDTLLRYILLAHDMVESSQQQKLLSIALDSISIPLKRACQRGTHTEKQECLLCSKDPNMLERLLCLLSFSLVMHPQVNQALMRLAGYCLKLHSPEARYRLVIMHQSPVSRSLVLTQYLAPAVLESSLEASVEFLTAIWLGTSSSSTTADMKDASCCIKDMSMDHHQTTSSALEEVLRDLSNHLLPVAVSNLSISADQDAIHVNRILETARLISQLILPERAVAICSSTLAQHAVTCRKAHCWIAIRSIGEMAAQGLNRISGHVNPMRHAVLPTQALLIPSSFLLHELNASLPIEKWEPHQLDAIAALLNLLVCLWPVSDPSQTNLIPTADAVSVLSIIMRLMDLLVAETSQEDPSGEGHRSILAVAANAWQLAAICYLYVNEHYSVAQACNSRAILFAKGADPSLRMQSAHAWCCAMQAQCASDAFPRDDLVEIFNCASLTAEIATLSSIAHDSYTEDISRTTLDISLELISSFSSMSHPVRYLPEIQWLSSLIKATQVDSL